jgi:sulfite exporter TauE/SafE
MDEIGPLAAFLVGLLNGVHCLGMCGGIVGALSLGALSKSHGEVSRWSLLLGYNFGRLFSYTLAGFMAGGLGLLLASAIPLEGAQYLLRAAAGVFMVLMGLYVAGWWMGLAALEKRAAVLWRYIEPRARGLLPVRSAGAATLVGMLWGWLPCGLVYSTLVWALSSGGPLQGGILMLAFGLGTLPNLLLIGGLAGRFGSRLRQPWVRRLAGSTIIAFGFYLLWVLLRDISG